MGNSRGMCLVSVVFCMVCHAKTFFLQVRFCLDDESMQLICIMKLLVWGIYTITQVAHCFCVVSLDGF